MCGFVGVVDRRPGQKDLFRLVDKGLSVISHRGPDATEIAPIDRDPTVYLAHARLSIIGGDNARQPMWDKPKGEEAVYIVYNGEVYNYKELANELGVPALSDTQVVLASYLKWGTDCFKRFNGMFALAIWDGRRQELILARDRWGIKPLYVTWLPNGVAFASELKGLLPFTQRPRISRSALKNYCLYGYTPEDQSIIRYITKVISGTWQKHHFTSTGATWPTLGEFGNGDIPHGFVKHHGADGIFKRAIKRHLIADVPVGVLLSGGIDSSLIAAYAAELHPGIQTFTMGFEEPEQDESKWAKAIAKYLGTTHHEFFITEKDVLDCLDKVVDTFCEPFADSSALPTYMLCQYVSRHVKTALAGDGGDELWCGYPRYWASEKIFKYKKYTKLFEYMLRYLPKKSRRLEKLHEVLKNRTFDNLWDVYRHTILHFQPEELEEVWNYGDVQTRKPVFHNGKPSIINLMEFDLNTYLPGDILVKSDRCSMAHGLELRVPFLDNEFAIFARGVPVNLRYKKKLLKQMLAQKIPKRLWNRPKQGFGIPMVKWLRGPLRGRVFDTLQYPECFSKIKVSEYLWDFFQEGNNRHTYKIWNLFMFHLWRERWLQDPTKY